MKNKMSHTIYFFLLMLLFVSYQPLLHSQTRLAKDKNEQNNKYVNAIIEKLQTKYKLTSEMLNIQNVNATEVVDSVVGLDLFGNKFKEMYQYDNHGNIIAEINQEWDGSKLVNDGRTTYTFNSDGKMTSQIRERWDGTSWVNYDKFTETYNANGQSIEELDQNWDGTQWVNSSRWTTNYDSEGNEISQISEDWNGSEWVPDSRDTRASVGADGSIVYLSESWDGSDWVNDSRSTIKYNDSNNFESQTEEYWDGTEFVNSYRTTFTYEEGRNTSVMGEVWDNESWVNEYRYSYGFDSNGRRISWFFENWNGTAWEGDYRFVYTYDANGNKTIDLIEEWDGSSFIGTSRKTFTYNNNGNVIFAIHESWDGANWTESPTFLGFFVAVNSENSNYYAFLSTRINVYYATITDVEQNNKLPNQFELSQNYPNPFNPSTTIEFSIPEESFVQLKVFNILGKEIATLVNNKYAAGSYKASFDGGNLPSGLYIAQMKAGNFSKSYKMMLLK